MSEWTFRDLFRQAMDQEPYPYQVRLAESPALPNLLEAPTGAGKTPASFLAWLYRRRFHPDPAVRSRTPRRLAYCLPMRVLVEQTVGVVSQCLRRLDLLNEGGANPDGVRLAVLMGGEDDGVWDIDPVGDTVLVGTQDMLLSRALNRGYGMSRFRWPVHFGLLNSDCLWVIDEVQLMGNGLATTAQLDAFRVRFGTTGPGPSLWMSATIAPEWLQTVDSRIASDSAIFRLDAKDRSHPLLAKRLNATKVLGRLPLDTAAGKAYAPAALAQAVSREHVAGTLTLVVLNTVRRVLDLFDALTRVLRKQKNAPEVLILHSRFRPGKRGELVNRLLTPPGPTGRIALASQVVEAGVDVSARTLFTELAPWASLVQRFGRLNRYGEAEDARAFWIDLDSEKLAAPYEAAALDASRARLSELAGQSVAPDQLPPATEGPVATHVLRQHDLVGLFDTTPDLSGSDVDVSRFIRGTDDLDVQVFWRFWDRTQSRVPPADFPAPARRELCPVPVGELRDFLKKRSPQPAVWHWDHLDRQWRSQSADALRPGLVLLLHREDGGYTEAAGWVGAKAKTTEPVPDVTGAALESTDDDARARGDWQTLRAHSDDVVDALAVMLPRLGGVGLPGEYVRALQLAARWHDRGKAHEIFQKTLLRADAAERTRARTIWAKAPIGTGRHSRPHFRHELASALAVLRAPLDGLSPDGRDLVAYLVASHHGKVRLAIRSLPDERPPRTGQRIALGIADGDRLPETDLGGEVVAPAVEMDLSVSELGLGAADEASWVERVTAWRDRIGPFRLAYLEALLVCADVQASRSPSRRD